MYRKYFVRSLLMISTSLLGSFTSLACSNRPDIIKQVQDDIRSRGVHFNVTFDFDEHRYVAICDWNTIPHKVSINQDYWVRMSDSEREVLLYHELGHCIWYKPDIREDVQDIMCYRFDYLSWQWLEHRDEMLAKYWN